MSGEIQINKIELTKRNEGLRIIRDDWETKRSTMKSNPNQYSSGYTADAAFTESIENVHKILDEFLVLLYNSVNLFDEIEKSFINADENIADNI